MAAFLFVLPFFRSEQNAAGTRPLESSAGPRGRPATTRSSLVITSVGTEVIVSFMDGMGYTAGYKEPLCPILGGAYGVPVRAPSRVVSGDLLTWRPRKIYSWVTDTGMRREAKARNAHPVKSAWRFCFCGGRPACRAAGYLERGCAAGHPAFASRRRCCGMFCSVMPGGIGCARNEMVVL